MACLLQDNVPGRKLMMFLQELHDLLETLLLLDIEAIAELLLVLPVIDHDGQLARRSSALVSLSCLSWS
jgi:hypothetical protein